VLWVKFGVNAPASVDVTYKKGSGQWSLLAAYPMATPNGQGITINGIFFKPPQQDEGRTQAELIYLPMPDENLKLEAVLNDGKRVSVSGWVSSGNVISDNIFTIDVPPSRIAALELMTQAYDIANFRDISLRPGNRTHPQALVPIMSLNIPGLEHRRINKFVSDFAKAFDLSSPEAAYATINRIETAEGWRKASVTSLAEAFKDNKDQPADPQWQAVREHARILDVWIWQGKTAIVTAKLWPQSPDQTINAPIDVRHLRLEEGQWRNAGNDRRNDEQQVIDMVQRVIKRSIDDSAQQHAPEIKQAASQLFEKIRSANYAEALKHYDAATGRWRDDYWKKLPFSGYYMVGSDWPGFALWICRTFKDNPITAVELGDVVRGNEKIMDRTGWPAVPYKLTLQDGTVLKGELSFEYSLPGADRPEGHWHGMEGIDWHHQFPEGLPKN
jgi:hypothetical protein